MPGAVHIYEVYIGEVTTYLWLCPDDVVLRSRGRGARPPKQLDHALDPGGIDGACTDCLRRGDGVSTTGRPTFATAEWAAAYERGVFLTGPLEYVFPQPAPGNVETRSEGEARAAVDFVPTSPESRLPTREECPTPQPPETWAARLARLKSPAQGRPGKPRQQPIAAKQPATQAPGLDDFDAEVEAQLSERRTKAMDTEEAA